MNPMPIWELIVVGLACLLGALSMVLPLYIGERLDQREQARAARKPGMPTAGDTEHYKSAA